MVNSNPIGNTHDSARERLQWDYDHEDLTIDHITNFAGHRPDYSRLGNRLADAGYSICEYVEDWCLTFAWNLALASSLCSAEDRGRSIGYDQHVREERGW